MAPTPHHLTTVGGTSLWRRFRSRWISTGDCCISGTALGCGFGMVGLTEPGFPGRVVVKTVHWFVLTSLPPMAFRIPDKAPLLSTVAAVALHVAIVMGAYEPF